MLTRIYLLPALAALTSVVRANVRFITPEPGDEIIGGGAITIEWEDDGETPSIDDLTTYTLFLCAGGNAPNSFVSRLSSHLGVGVWFGILRTRLLTGTGLPLAATTRRNHPPG